MAHPIGLPMARPIGRPTARLMGRPIVLLCNNNSWKKKLSWDLPMALPWS